MATIAISRRERTIQTGTTTDRALLRGFLYQDRRYAAYAICDLEDREFERTRWGVAWADGQPIAIALEYTGLTPQPLFLMGRNDGLAAILGEVLRPRTAYLAALREAMPAVEAHYRVDAGPPMVRMWLDRSRFRPASADRVSDVRRLHAGEIGELNRLYQLGFASWLPASAISDGVYFGIRAGGKLIAAAGTHVISPTARVAVVGNVLTHADHRGRGYATAVTSAVTEHLLTFCDEVFLNVRSDNPPALQAYGKLGYAEHVRFEERLVHRLGPPWSGLTSSLRRLFAPRKENPPQ